MQKYLYKLQKEIKVTTNYYKHMGVNCGTEIYYKLDYKKQECYLKINKYFKEKNTLNLHLGLITTLKINLLKRVV